MCAVGICNQSVACMAKLNEENKVVHTTWMVVQCIHGWLNSTDETSGLPK